MNLQLFQNLKFNKKKSSGIFTIRKKLKQNLTMIFIYSIHPVKWPKFKRLTTVYIDKDVKKLELSYTNSGIYNHYRKQLGSFLQNQTHAHHITYRVYFQAFTQEKWKHVHKKELYTNVFSTLFKIVPNWKQSKCPLTRKWIKIFWYIHTMEYYSSIERLKPLTHTTWMNFKNIIMSDRI